MPDLNNSVLVVEDEFLISEVFCAHVVDLGLTVCGAAASADEAVALARQHRPAVVLMDVRLTGEKDGVDAALAIHEQVGSRVIFITGSREPATLERIALDHPHAVLFKPVTEYQLKRVINEALERALA